MRRLIAVVALAALLAPGAAAYAHKGNPKYASTVRGVSPLTPGVTVEVLNRDDRLELVNRSTRTIVIEGYNDEPYARLRPDGTVEVNRRSPAFYLNEDRFANAEVPPSATGDARPRWQTVDRTGRFEWHDHRMHWMGEGTPPAVKDTSVKTKVFDWSVPIRADDREGAIAGTLAWIPSEAEGLSILAYVGIGGLLLGAAVFMVVMRRRRHGELSEAW